MDLDDLIEDLIPKKKLKKLKKRYKQKSLWGVLFAFLRSLFGSSREDEKRPKYERERPKVEREERPTERTTSAKPDPLLASLEQAQAYRMNIEGMAIAAEPGSMERLRLDGLSERVAEWTAAIEEIVELTLMQQDDPLLEAERERVPKAIVRLEKQLESADNPQLRQKLERTLANRRRQLAQLEQAANGRQMAELKVENTLAQLGIIYSQLQSGRYVRERGGYERLSADVGEEVAALDDYLDALNEVHGWT